MVRQLNFLKVVLSVVIMTMPAFGIESVTYTDDFSSWINVNAAQMPGYEFGSSLLSTTNTDALRWNLLKPAGFTYQRWNTYSITCPNTITSITFDWRFSNDDFNDRLVFRLLDDANTVLWTATSTIGGIAKPLVLHEFVLTNSNALKFEYRQLSNSIWGKSAFFDSSNIDDWDALVDNVTLTFYSNPEPNQPPLPPGQTYSPYGICAHAPGGPELYTLMDEIKAVGIGWMRMDINWYYVQPSAGAFNWLLIDTVAAAAEAGGVKIYASIWGTPPWATSGSPYTGVPNNAADFYNFCYNAALRYKGRITHWGLWNEANGSGWTGTEQQFIDIILKNGADAIHAADPNAKVGGPELAQQVSNWCFWLKDCLQQAGNKLDFVTHHIYKPTYGEVTSTLEMPTAHGNDPNFWTSYPPSVKEVLMYAGCSNKPFWLTETGLGSCTNPAQGWLCAGESGQAQFITGILTDWYTTQPGRDWVDKIFTYELYDQPEGATNWNFGILTAYPNYTPKEAFYAYQSFIGQHGIPCLFNLTGDLNHDCFVNFKDFSILVEDWLQCNYSNPAMCP